MPNQLAKRNTKVVTMTDRLRIPKHRYAGCVVVGNDGNIYLQKRDAGSDISNPNSISTFGGRVENGESATTGIIRELNEELGITLQSQELQYLGYIEHFDQARQLVVAGSYYYIRLSEHQQMRCTEGKLFVVKPETNLSTVQSLGPVTGEILHRYHLTSVDAPTITDKIALISMLLQYAAYEAQSYWQRTTIFLTVNSVMIGLIITLIDKMSQALLLFGSTFGILLNFLWLRSADYGKFLAEKWREDAREVARLDASLKPILRSLLGNPRIEAPRSRKPSQLMKDISLVFLTIWVLLGLYVLGQLFFSMPLLTFPQYPENFSGHG